MTESNDGRKKLLSLDGGGIRGVLTLGVLASIEKLVGRPLGEYFDYIAGTSTGAIIAAGLAKGMSVAELQEFYTSFGPQMFEQRFLLQRYKSLYTSDPLQKQLKFTFGKDASGADTTLGSKDIKPLLLIVTRNWTTDSPWPISSNKAAVYNHDALPYCNLQIPLWQLVRASTAAPIYFPPEVLRWDPKDETKSFVFVDGGVTPYNNPAFLLYRMATAPEYCLEWPTGEDKMLMISVGTGSAPKTGPTFQTPDQSIPVQIPGLISALMYGAEVDQDVSCRTVGRCTFGNVIDREVGDMIPRVKQPGGKYLTFDERQALPIRPLSEGLGRAFLYARYNPELTQGGLEQLGIRDFKLEDLLRMDLATPENILKLAEVGAAAGKKVSKEQFGSFLD
ncbi:MAG: patatin-like phospholipase family protein [Terracidiphilus sp.]